MKTLISVAAFGLMSATPALAAQPLSAARPDPVTTASAPSAAAMAAPAPAASARSSAKPTRYCVIQDAVTGTRLNRKVCNTREGWLKQGFDPLNPKAQ